jgi:hypothetical protein
MRSTVGARGYWAHGMSGFVNVRLSLQRVAWQLEQATHHCCHHVLWGLLSFLTRKKRTFLRLNIFEVCTIESPSLLWWLVFFRFFIFFAQFERENRLSSGLVSYSKLLNLSRPFSSWVFRMIIRRDVFVLADTIWIFELWFLIPQIMFHGPAEPPCFTSKGSRFSGLLYLGKPRRSIFWVVDSNPSNCLLASSALLSITSWPSAPLLHSTMGFSPQVISHSGPVVPQFQFENNFKFPKT